ncbi:MAG: 3-beta hydroxysteroid dehydrogenase [Pseudonocardia sp.]|jgi:nucleoside-diphosphate-sugar epimerase|nr:3-beta hydroxysteroid dehydrogenase [Pseudonocardia sp.]
MRIFVTGASGWIGSAVVPELLEAGHEVVGLARSDASACALEAAGAEVHRGSLDDLDALGGAAAASDGVIHLAFKHEEAFSGDFATATDADRHAIEAFGEALAGSDRPLVIASGLAGLQPGEAATEDDVPDAASPAGERTHSERAALALADRGVRSSSVRLPPTVHGDGDNGFVASLVGMAREHGASGYIGDGANHWPAVHRLDAARLFRLAVEGAPAGSVLHGVAEEGVPTRAIAEAIGRGLGLPAMSVAPDAAEEHFGWLAGLFGLDVQASSARTQELLGWQPTHQGLVEDLDEGHYFSGS